MDRALAGGRECRAMTNMLLRRLRDDAVILGPVIPFADAANAAGAARVWTSAQPQDPRAVLVVDGAPNSGRFWMVTELDAQRMEAKGYERLAFSSEPPADLDPVGARGSVRQAADAAYLRTFIDGTADIMDEGIMARLEPMFGTYANDPSMMDLLNRAANAYADAAVRAAQLVLGQLQSEG